MRDTDYATELHSASIRFNASNEGRIEHIFVKENNQDEIRFSWWKDGRMIIRPLDLTEKDLLTLMQNAIKADVFTPIFQLELLRTLISKTEA
jgi:hypothetical protein